MKNFDEILAEIATKGNTRHIPDDTTGNDYGYLDFSTNDYLGLADDKDLRFQFLKEAAIIGLTVVSCNTKTSS